MRKTRYKFQPIKQHDTQLGFTVIELAVVLLVSATLVVQTAPAFINYFEKNHLKGAAETLYSRLHQARSESIKRFATTYVSIAATGNSNWSFGISDTTNCDSTQSLGGANDCTLSISGTDVLYTENNNGLESPFSNIRMTAYSDVALTSAANPLEISFEPVRGTSTGGGIGLASPSGWTINAVISPLGKVDMCSPAGSSYVSGYSEC